MSRRPSGRASDPTLVIGAGPHGLTIAVRLLHERMAHPDELMVIDPAGRWLAGWRSAFDALGIEHLRSPVVHHPHPDPDALLHFVRQQRRGTELHGQYLSPGTELFDDFCGRVIDTSGLTGAVTAGRVCSVEPDGTTIWTDPAGVERCIRARRIVVASNPMVPFTPAELSGDASANLPDAVHAGDVDRRGIRRGEHVAIVGGGLTAGHLACWATSQGARVTLVTRRPLVQREFDTDPGWLGPRHMRGYLATRCPVERARLAIEARGGGSMPGWMLGRLDSLVEDGGLTMDVVTNTDDRRTGSCGALVEHLIRSEVDHLWCATGWRLATRRDPVIGPLVQASSCATVDEFLALGPRLELTGTEVPVHVMGRPATLQLGPTAGNLSGARRGSDLIVGREPDAIAA